MIMKPFYTIALAFILFLPFCGYAEEVYTYGSPIDFQTGFVGSTWHPWMKITMYDSNDETDTHLNLISVILKSPSDTYYTYPEGESTLLIKFDDGSIAKLTSFGDTNKSHDNITLPNNQPFYYIWRNYILSDGDLDNILNKPIVKVRVELGNGSRKDYEITKKHAQKVLKKLNESFKKVSESHQIRKMNTSRGLKDDF